MCISAIEIQTIGPISIKFGTVEDHNLKMVFMYVIGPFFTLQPLIEGAKPLQGKPGTLEQTLLNKSCKPTLTYGYSLFYTTLSVLLLFHLP
jgi:hypothetical protein